MANIFIFKFPGRIAFCQKGLITHDILLQTMMSLYVDATPRYKPGVGNICVTLREFVFFLVFNFISFLELLFGELEITYLKQSI